MCIAAGIQTCRADSIGTFSADDEFQSGWHEASVGSAVYITSVDRANNRPDINYASGFLQAAYTITSPGTSDGLFRGSLQLAPEVFGAGIFHGPGSYVAGGTIWLRYNFIRPGWRVVPYFQAGAGGTSLDIPHNYDGKDFNFNLDLGAGARYFINEHCSLNGEYRFQHISNADLWAHNIGVNTAGPSLSVSFFF